MSHANVNAPKPFELSTPDERFPKTAVEQSIVSRFEQQAAQYPHHVAVQAADATLTYDDLNRGANRLAHVILAAHGEAVGTIALLFDQGAEVITAFMGVLKADKIVVPLDPAYPPSRTAYMVEDAQTALIVTHTAHEGLAHDLAQGRCPVLNIDALPATSAESNPGVVIPPDAFAYILYTSGSTGEPKGVIENHRNALHFAMVFTHSFPLSPADRLTLLTSCSFSASMADLFSALLNGASLHLFDVKQRGVSHLAHWLRQEAITVYHSVPTVYRHFVRTLTGDEAFPALKLIYLAGEPIYTRDVELFKRHFAAPCRFLSALGSTEMKIIQQYFIDHETQLPGPFVPVGYSVDDSEIWLLDDAGQRITGDQPGEIAVRSPYISPGYWRKPEQTRATFLPDPAGGVSRIYRTGDLGRLLPDGCLVHLGRQDAQVKVRGYRVELTEVEAALLSTGDLSEAAVTLYDNPSAAPILVAYVAPAASPVPTASVLRRKLSAILPDYMIPSTFVGLDAIPLTPTGKVDRNALPAPSDARPHLQTAYAPPRTPTEARLAELWTEVLGLDTVGIHDPFLELGGHSLLAGQLIARVVDVFGVDIPLPNLLQAPTVADMAVLITQRQAEQVAEDELEALLAEVEALAEDDSASTSAEMPKGQRDA
ncbi:MAG: non-ribosomal peptide synthetase, partial [Candidatus Tectomicrobia bacterium]|nr:non-ribosomal peptide synthetase [Candidatus Tectomicrobia bacterium]